MKVLLLLIAVVCSVQIVTSTSCFWNSGCPYKYLSNKTPYELVRGDIRDSLVKHTDCEPVSIWGFIRHGHRNPGTVFGNYMKDALVIKDYIVSSYERGNSSLCAQDVENLQKWQVDKEMFDKAYQLTQEGYLESEGIGRRLRQAFPKLLAKLDENDYQFRPGPGAWMVDSVKAFVDGIYDSPLTIQPTNTDFDIISPFDTCKKYLDFKLSDKPYEESMKFLSSPEYLAAKDKMQRRLGIDYTLTDTNISALYDLCRYPTSGLTNKFSPWCALFTTEDFEALEYVHDLRHYYRSGYGTPTNELIGQITLTDLLKSFQDSKTGKGKKITAYFTHATMMDMVYTALKLFKDDEPPTGAFRKPDRKWRSSKLAVFSSNLMVVLNKCNKGNDDYNVAFYMNEEPLQSICKEGVCTWKEFEDKLSSFNTSTEFCEYY
ncbi:hypothetical protein PYW07_015396 [Mythimna separata]|uniref:Multiple inositol polyphosphate phosphatase 1 n=1 Tax=Mythimna separata TaxID=271217 RepID=A0AAD8DZT1_MYTSE|nr:hypothetical protein PYW07_015396 [Mythimna separata]